MLLFTQGLYDGTAANIKVFNPALGQPAEEAFRCELDFYKEADLAGDFPVPELLCYGLLPHSHPPTPFIATALLADSVPSNRNHTSQPAIQWRAAVSGAVRALHSKGWLHGDPAMRHLRISRDQPSAVLLIDFDNAHRSEDRVRHAAELRSFLDS